MRLGSSGAICSAKSCVLRSAGSWKALTSRRTQCDRLLGPASPKRVASFDSRGAYLALGEVVVVGLRGSRPHRQVAG